MRTTSTTLRNPWCHCMGVVWIMIMMMMILFLDEIRAQTSNSTQNFDNLNAKQIYVAPLDEQAVVGDYMVVFKDQTSDREMDDLLKTEVFDFFDNDKAPPFFSARLERRFRYALNAVVLHFIPKDDKEVDKDLTVAVARRNLFRERLEALLQHDSVIYIEEDQKIQLSRINNNQRFPPSWGLDRIDQENRPLDHRYKHDYTGQGVNVYVLDSGILSTHVDLAPRVRCGYNHYESWGESCEDLYNHGTHVAGILGGKKYGVAKQVNLINCKIINQTGGGTVSGAIAGLDFVMSEMRSMESSRVVVVNLSLGADYSPSLNRAVDRTFDAGAVVVVSAGNDNNNACLKSPASAENTAVTVAASTQRDARASFSNYGRCVDVFAPGVNIASANIRHDRAEISLTGTSASSPHVAGVAALYAESNPNATAATIRNWILEDAIQDAVTDTQGSPSRLVSTLKVASRSATT